MLPTLDHHFAIDATASDFAKALRQRGFNGDIELDLASRASQATDNSIYYQLPLGILYPTSTEDVVLIATVSQTEPFTTQPLCARGGATGTNAQSLTTGWVVDMSRHMNKILEINAEERWARVQAGVVKDALNAALIEHKLFFSPDLSTSNRATIGGMINTDASGQGSLVYGKTRDHLLSLTNVLADGTLWQTEPLNETDFNQLCDQNNTIGKICRTARDIANTQQALINSVYPPLNRALTGYDFAHLKCVDGKNATALAWDINSLICGSEGTLCFVTEAKVHLDLLPTEKAMVVIYYRDFIDALKHSQQLMPAKPTSIETIDNTVVGLAQRDAIWHKVGHYFNADNVSSTDSKNTLGAVSFVEVTAHDPDSLATQITRIKQQLTAPSSAEYLGFQVVDDKAGMTMLNQMRKKAVGLLGNMAGEKRPVPFVEDAAVPPENLAAFIADFRALLDAEHLRYGMFGHADAGVIHVRPALDMRDAAAIARVRKITDAVFALTQRYGGVLWGEHGKGVRSEYSPATFGDFYPYLQRIKASFDPHNRLNPGKVATPNAATPLLQIDELTTRGQRDALIANSAWQEFGDAMYCNGNGACFDWNPSNTMCPSFKGSGLRLYSPKGRATLLKEWLVQLQQQGYDASTAPAHTGLPAAALNLMKKCFLAIRSVGPLLQLESLQLKGPREKNSRKKSPDFSQQVYQALHTCLACKACSTQCPVHVDVPSFRSQFFAHYFTRYLRPLSHYAIGYIELCLPTIAKLPSLYNGITQSLLGKLLAKWLLKLTAMPALSTLNFTARCKDLGIAFATEERINSLSAIEKQRAVILVQDVFTRYFDSELVIDIAVALQRLGFYPMFAPYSPNGKPLHVLGFLHQFEKTAQATTRRLQQWEKTGIPLVGIEPSMSLSYRSEYNSCKNLEQVPKVALLQEWLLTQREFLVAQQEVLMGNHDGNQDGDQAGSKTAGKQFQLLLHCTEATADVQAARTWASVFSALGFELEVLASGCCGMAGTFGHEVDNQALSKRIYELSWQPIVEENAYSGKALTATGYSCRCQVQRFSGAVLRHPLQHLLACLPRQNAQRI